MASNGLIKRAKHGKCRMCQRVRKTDTQVVSVGEVRHGFACGYIWECLDVLDCEQSIKIKLEETERGTLIHERIKRAIKTGRLIK